MIIKGDCIAEMQKMEAASVDLIFSSPPYEDCRTYGIDWRLKGQDWVDWMVRVYIESLRVCRGLVAYVVAGRCSYAERVIANSYVAHSRCERIARDIANKNIVSTRGGRAPRVLANKYVGIHTARIAK